MWIKTIVLVGCVVAALAADEPRSKKKEEARGKRNLQYNVAHHYSPHAYRLERRISTGPQIPLYHSQFFPGPRSYSPYKGRPHSLPPPPYAVQMEPLVHYSQRDPLYDTNFLSLNADGQDDLLTDNNHLSENVYGPQKHVIERPVYIKEPEPIIEIIIKESNVTLPPPPAPPAPPPKKKEEVQVFYVKYKKNPHGHGHGKESIIYDTPVPAISPPVQDEHEEPPPQAYHHQEVVTSPPPPSTTLRTIIRPDSETYHSPSGVKVTFGKEGFDYDKRSSKTEDLKASPDDNRSVQLPQGRQLSSFPPGPSAPRRPPTYNFNPSSTNFRQPQPYRPFTQFREPTQNFPRPSPQEYSTLPKYIQFSQPPKSFPPPRPVPPQFQRQPIGYQPFDSSRPQPQFRPETHFPITQSPLITQKPVSFNQFSQKGPQFGEARPQVGEARPQFGERRPQLTQFGEARPQLTEGRPPFSEARPHLSEERPQFNEARPQLSEVRPQFGETRPPHGEERPQFNEARPQFGETRPQTQPKRPPLPQFQQAGPQYQPTPPQFQRPQFQQPGPQYQQQPVIPQHQQPTVSQHQQPGNLQNHQPSPQHQQSGISQHQQPEILQHQQTRIPQHQQPGILQHQQQGLPQHQQPGFPQFQQQQYQQPPQFNQLPSIIPPGGELIESIPKYEQHISVSEPFKSSSQSQHQNQQPQYNIQPQLQQSSIQLSSTDFNDKMKQQTQPQPNNEYNEKLQQQLREANAFQESIRQSSPQYYNFQQSQSLDFYQSTSKPQTYSSTTQSTTTTSTTTQKPSTTTKDPKILNAQLPDEVPDDLRQQLLSSGILNNAHISVLDYDKVGDIPLSALPPDQLANFYSAGGAQQIQAAGNEPIPAIAERDFDTEASEIHEVAVKPEVQMKVVRYDPESDRGQQVQEAYVKDGATQVEPVVLNDEKYNRYLPLKVSGAQFPIPDVPELKGKKISSVVVLAPIAYDFSSTRQTREAKDEEVELVEGQLLKDLLKDPTTENFKKFLDKENETRSDRQSVILLVTGSNEGAKDKEIFMYDVATQTVSKLDGELSSAFVEAAEANSSEDTKASASSIVETRVPYDLEPEGSENLDSFIDVSGIPADDDLTASETHVDNKISGISKTGRLP